MRDGSLIYEGSIDISSLYNQPSADVMPEITDLNVILEGLETNSLDYDIMHEIFMKNPNQRSSIGGPTISHNLR